MDSHCSNCRKTLHVPSFLMDIEGVCPFCKGIFKVKPVVDLASMPEFTSTSELRNEEEVIELELVSEEIIDES